METLEQEVLLAREDEQKLTELIQSQTKWILSCAARTVRRYVTTGDDEWSVALMAFSEAVQGYEPDKGAFRAFASVVIRRRLLDFLRSEGRHSAEIAVMPGAFEGEVDEEQPEGVQLQVQRKLAESAVLTLDDQTARTREEIAEAQELLSGYGFSFFELAECSPKAGKTKNSCALAVRTLLAEPALMEKLRKSRTLPMKEISASSGVSRKILDRHRKYIIAAAELLNGEFPILAEYLATIRKG